MRWAYGVTTVPERQQTLLPKTLASMAAAGFDRPRLFVDGGEDSCSWVRQFGMEVTLRSPRTNAWTNWWLAMTELLARNPVMDRYAVFQDDLVCCRGLREYLERRWLPGPGYANLYTFPRNQSLCKHDSRGRQVGGWFEADQMGKGALVIVMDRDAVVQLLSSRCVVEKCLAVDPRISVQHVDGGIVNALSDRHRGPPGWKEWCHNPSLVQHSGHSCSVIGPDHNMQPLAESFRGEGWDVLELLRSK